MDEQGIWQGLERVAEMIKRNNCESCIHYAVCGEKITYKSILERVEDSLSDMNKTGVKINVECQHFMRNENVRKVRMDTK